MRTRISFAEYVLLFGEGWRGRLRLAWILIRLWWRVRRKSGGWRVPVLLFREDED